MIFSSWMNVNFDLLDNWNLYVKIVILVCNTLGSTQCKASKEKVFEIDCVRIPGCNLCSHFFGIRNLVKKIAFIFAHCFPWGSEEVSQTVSQTMSTCQRHKFYVPRVFHAFLKNCYVFRDMYYVGSKRFIISIFVIMVFTEDQWKVDELLGSYVTHNRLWIPCHQTTWA